MLKLNLQYFGHLPWRADSLEKILMLGKIRARGEGDDRGWDGWMVSSIQWTWVWAKSGRWWRTGKPGVLQSMGLQRVRYGWATEQEQQSGHSLHIPFPSSLRTSHPLPVLILNLKKIKPGVLETEIHSCSESILHSKRISVQSVAFEISESHHWLPISSAIKFPLQTHLLLVSWRVQLKDILSIHLQT